MKKRRIWAGLLVLAAVFLAGCSAGDEKPEPELPPEPEEGVLIYAALNPVTTYLKTNIKTYNKTHPETQIEIRDYSDDAGPERLMTELMLGEVPDIMEMQRLGYHQGDISNPSISSSFEVKNTEALWRDTPFDADTSDLFWMPYRSLVQRGYLEDLWPYIEKDPRYGRERIIEGPLKAAEINGGLYILPKSVSISTLAGPKSVVGDRCGWTLEELIEAFAAMPESSTVLRYNTTRQEVFFNVLAPLLDQFIDWETGECAFDSQSFREMLNFLSLFPDEFATWLSSSQLERELAWQRLDGLQMLEPVLVNAVHDKNNLDAVFGREIAYVGYPTVDGSSGSSFIFHGPILAMSSVCRDKEAAWNFMSRQLRAESKSISWMLESIIHSWISIPLNRIGYNTYLRAGTNLSVTYFSELYSGGPLVPSRKPTEEDRQQFEELFNSTTQLYWPDEKLSATVWDAIGPYFTGDKTLDETVELVQRRAILYVNENR